MKPVHDAALDIESTSPATPSPKPTDWNGLVESVVRMPGKMTTDDLPHFPRAMLVFHGAQKGAQVLKSTLQIREILVVSSNLVVSQPKVE